MAQWLAQVVLVALAVAPEPAGAAEVEERVEMEWEVRQAEAAQPDRLAESQGAEAAVPGPPEDFRGLAAQPEQPPLAVLEGPAA